MENGFQASSISPFGAVENVLSNCQKHTHSILSNWIMWRMSYTKLNTYSGLLCGVCISCHMHLNVWKLRNTKCSQSTCNACTHSTQSKIFERSRWQAGNRLHTLRLRSKRMLALVPQKCGTQFFNLEIPCVYAIRTNLGPMHFSIFRYDTWLLALLTARHADRSIDIDEEYTIFHQPSSNVYVIFTWIPPNVSSALNSPTIRQISEPDSYPVIHRTSTCPMPIFSFNQSITKKKIIVWNSIIQW